MALFRKAPAPEPTPIDGVDCLYLDLDGVVYKGPDAIPHAVESIRGIAVRSIYLTNNASRTDAEVAEHLSSFGLDVQPDDVVTSPQARFLTLHTPGGFDRFTLAVGTPAAGTTTTPPEEVPPDPAALAAMASSYGIEILGPPPTP